jgi:hypothetical protein
MTKKQVEIYSDDDGTSCRVCGWKRVHLAYCDSVFVCERCIEHPELVDEWLQKEAAEQEEDAARHRREAARLRGLIGKLKLPSLAEFEAAVDAASAEDVESSLAQLDEAVGNASLEA